MKIQKKIKIALVLDNNKIDLWQYQAIKEITDLAEIQLILNCTNTKIKRSIKKFLFYYFLNILAIRNKFSKKITFETNKIEKFNFESSYEGAWQVFPEKVIRKLKEKNISVVIKFGMGLLKRKKSDTNFPIFSFHHGDPDKYRGRPAGFYELLFDESSCGVIVQDIGDILDGGSVYAKGYSKIFKYSYKKTVENYYQISRFILRQAIKSYINKKSIITKDSIEPKGKIYRLPNNNLVLKFIFKLLKFKLKRVLYGLFFEKDWKVSLSEYHLDPNKNTKLDITDANTLEVNTKFSFYADPFFSPNSDEVYLEALRSSTGIGDIIAVDSKSSKIKKEIFNGDHYSYPSVIENKGLFLMFPEVASHSSPFVVDCNDPSKKKIYLKGFKNKRLVDGTLLIRDGIWYLFAGNPDLANNVLHLYYSKGLTKTFAIHPCSPIRINPEGSRMGGNIISKNNELFRVGQDNRFGYGERLNIFKINTIDEKVYSEKLVSYVEVKGKFGPHTINIKDDRIIFDFYVNKFNVLSWYKRMLGLNYSILKKITHN